MAYAYYEGLLSLSDKEIYRALRRGLSSCERAFGVPRADTKRLGDVFSMLKLDDPLIFHVGKLQFSYTDASSKITVKPEYTMKRDEYSKTLDVISKRVKKIMAPLSGKDGADAELFIHDYIVKNVRYDRLTKTYSHEVTGPLCHGIGVCEGMAKTFKLLCDAAGIDCAVAAGIGVPPEEASGKKSERHAWNVVFVREGALGVDVTFDASLSEGGNIRYDYFNVPDGIMSRSHSSPDFPLPACRVMRRDPYSLAGMSFDGVSDIAPALRAAAGKEHRAEFRITSDFDKEALSDSITHLMRSDKRYSKFSRYSFKINPSSGVVELILTPREDKESKNC